MKDIGIADRQELGRWASNKVENSHQPFRRRERATLRVPANEGARQKFQLHATSSAATTTKSAAWLPWLNGRLSARELSLFRQPCVIQTLIAIGLTAPMRIMHLVNHCLKGLGNVNVSVDLACTQATQGCNVAYACAGGDLLDVLTSANVTIYEIPEPHINVRNFFAAQYMLLKAIRSFRPDIIHVHMAAASVLVQPYRLLGYKTVSTVHNDFESSVWFMGLAKRVICCSKSGLEEMKRYGVNPKKLRVVLNGVIDTPRLKSKFSIPSLYHPSIISVCSLRPRKGVAELLNAFKIVCEKKKTAHLYIMGKGPGEAEYRGQAQRLGLAENVTFLGYQDDPRGYLCAADIFVLASHADPGPLVIIEARDAGCAIVGTQVGGIPEMLDFGAAGILVPPKQVEPIARAILSLLNDPSLLASYSKRAKQNVSRFSVSRVCAEVNEIYAEML